MLEIGQEWVLYTTPFRLKEVSAGPTGGEIIPNVVALYAKDNGSGVSTLCYTNDAGTEICLPTVGPIVTGSGTANRLAKWTGTSTLGDFVPTAGSVLFAGVSGIGQEDNANFFWDDTNNRLGIGTATPDTFLQVVATVKTDPVIRISSTSSVGLGLTINNLAGATRHFIAGATDDFITGTVAGDAGVTWPTAHKFWFGLQSQAARFAIGTSGEWGVGVTPSFGVANSIFTSNGTGVAPSWNTTLVVTTVTASGLTQGSVVFAGVGGLLGQDNAHFFWDDTNDHLGIGLNTGLLSKLHVSSNSAAPDAVVHSDHYSTVVNAGFRGRTARGTLAAPTATQADDQIASFTGIGFGSSFGSGADAGIFCKAAETFVSTTSKGTYLTLETTPTASATRAERFRVGPAGQWGIGGATFGTAGQVFTSSGASAAPSWTTISSAAHDLLDGSANQDTLAGTVVRGDLIVGNSTPKWSRIAKGSAGAFLRGDGTDTLWSTLILPNAATANRIVYASATNTYGESANLAYDGTDFLLGSGTRARMSAQNRFRYLNSIVVAISTATTTIATSTFTSLDLASEIFDTDTLHDNTTNNTRITAGLTGKYFVAGLSDFTANAAGVRILRVFKNNTTNVLQSPSVLGGSATDNAGVNVSGFVSLAAGDYIELQAWQNSGISLTNHNTITTNFSAAYLGE